MRRIIVGSSLAAGAAVLVGGVLWANYHRGTPAAPPPVPGATVAAEATTPAPRREARVEAVWENKIRYVTDTVAAADGPAPMEASFVGRVRLFPTDEPAAREADGTVVVKLYGCKPQVDPTEPLLLEEWKIDAGSAKSFLTADASDPEYTFVLPSSSYTLELTQLRLDVEYQPQTGQPLTATGAVLTAP